MIPRTWPAACKNAQAIFIDIQYTLNGNGKPFAVKWSATQGLKHITRTFERDIRQEVVDGKIEEFAKENLIGTALSNDLHGRASEMAEIIR